jgi:hypothetical protein
MFEAICIKRQSDFTGTPIDLGFLAEALLFYRRVHLVASADIFKFLVRTCGADVLLELLRSGMLEMTYLENGLGIRTENRGTPSEKHDFVTWDFPGFACQKVLPETLQELTGKAGKGRRLAHQFLPFVKPVRFTEEDATGGLAEIQDVGYVRRTVYLLMKHFVPEYKLPQPFIFDVEQDGKQFRIRTNIDFQMAKVS